jgi:CRP/FNR family cyclic AMP-dependent transcriptional regulator
MRFGKGKKIFSQGDRADAIYFVQSGRVKISVVSTAGKEVVLAMLGPHDFFGEAHASVHSAIFSKCTLRFPFPSCISIRSNTC